MPEFAFNLLQPIFDNNIEKYELKCAKNKENAIKRWNPKVSERIETDAKNADKEKEKEKGKDKEKDKEKEKEIQEQPKGSDTPKQIKERELKKELKEESIRFIAHWNTIFKTDHTATPDFINAYITARKKYANTDVAK